MDIKELNEKLSNAINEINEQDKDIETLKQLLQDEKEVKITAETEFEQGNWDHVDPTTYSLDTVQGRLEGYAYVEETEEGNWTYNFSGDYLEQVYAGKDEDGYPDFDYVPSGETETQNSEPFATKEQAIEAFVNYLKEMCSWIDVEEA